MNCLEAQSKIMAFIDNDLPDDELKEFIKHIKSCDNCAEELEIYYTLVVVMKQLDDGENISGDFRKQLNNKLDYEMVRMSTAKRIATSTLVVFLTVILCALVWLYEEALDSVYSYEQNSKLESQGDYYFSDTFSDDMFEPYLCQEAQTKHYLEIMKRYNEEDDSEIVEKNRSLEFMKKVREYNQAQTGEHDVPGIGADKGENG